MISLFSSTHHQFFFEFLVKLFMNQNKTRQRFLFLSSNGSWGGSEELWSRTAEVLALDGHEVIVFIQWRDKNNDSLQRLRKLGCVVKDSWFDSHKTIFRILTAGLLYRFLSIILREGLNKSV
jgi:hypothetical protein